MKRARSPTIVSILILFVVTAAAGTARAECHEVTISDFKVIHHKAAGDQNVASGYEKTGSAVDFYLDWNDDDHPAGEGHNVTITYTYGDGATGGSASHTYAIGGTKNVSVTVSCTHDGDTADDSADGVTVNAITGIEITHVGGEAVGENPRMSYNDANSCAGRVLPVGTPGSDLIDWLTVVTATGDQCAYAKNGAMKDVDLPDASFATANGEWITDTTLYARINYDWSGLVAGFNEQEELLHGAGPYLETTVASVKHFYDGDGNESAGNDPNWFNYYKSNAGGGGLHLQDSWKIHFDRWWRHEYGPNWR